MSFTKGAHTKERKNTSSCNFEIKERKRKSDSHCIAGVFAERINSIQFFFSFFCFHNFTQFHRTKNLRMENVFVNLFFYFYRFWLKLVNEFLISRNNLNNLTKWKTKIKCLTMTAEGLLTFLVKFYLSMFKYRCFSQKKSFCQLKMCFSSLQRKHFPIH